MLSIVYIMEMNNNVMYVNKTIFNTNRKQIK